MSPSIHCHGVPLTDPAASRLEQRPDARVLHFFRHGEALHQARNADAKTRGAQCRCFDPVPNGGRSDYRCPYWSEDLVDSPLTALGRQQTLDRGVALDAEVVLTSPMTRTLESSKLAFPPGITTIVMPELRPRIGRHRHSKRGARSEMARRFPSADLSRVTEEEDQRWSEAPEARDALERRAAAFLVYALARPERRIAVATHFTLLLALLLPADDPFMLGPSGRPAGSPALLDISGGSDPREPAQVGETRSFVVTRAG